MTKPFFSIIIPALNEEKYLPHLLDDLSKQSYRDYEVIVVDGQSDDKTVFEAKKFAKSLPKLTILTSPRRNVSIQRNFGAKKSRGQYILFMDADNHLPLSFLAGIYYRVIDTNPDAFSTYLGTDSTLYQHKMVITILNLYMDIQISNHRPLFIEAFVGIKKTVFDKIGGFNPQKLYAEGASFATKIQKYNYNIHIFKDPIYYYSLRRVVKNGILSIASKVSQAQLARILNIPLPATVIKKMYPMNGGRMFDTSPNSFFLTVSKANPSERVIFKNKITKLFKLLNSPISTDSLPKLKQQLLNLLK